MDRTGWDVCVRRLNCRSSVERYWIVRPRTWREVSERRCVNGRIMHAIDSRCFGIARAPVEVLDEFPFSAVYCDLYVHRLGPSCSGVVVNVDVFVRSIEDALDEAWVPLIFSLVVHRQPVIVTKRLRCSASITILDGNYPRLSRSNSARSRQHVHYNFMSVHTVKKSV